VWGVDGAGDIGSPNSGTTLQRPGNIWVGTSVVVNGYHVEASETSAGSSGSAITLDFATASNQFVTMTANCTFTFSNPVAGGNYTLRLLQDSTGGWTYTWPSNVRWMGGSAPTGSTANKTDIIDFYYDGTYYYGVANLNYSTP
jgi:hypothetical protein